MKCDWCNVDIEWKAGKRFCCSAHRHLYHSACRKFTVDMLVKGFISKADLRRRYGEDERVASTGRD